MPVLSITVTTEVIQHANNIIQEGRGTLVLARRQDRWELLPVSPVADIAIQFYLDNVEGAKRDGSK